MTARPYFETHLPQPQRSDGSEKQGTAQSIQNKLLLNVNFRSVAGQV